MKSIQQCYHELVSATNTTLETSPGISPRNGPGTITERITIFIKYHHGWGVARRGRYSNELQQWRRINCNDRIKVSNMAEYGEYGRALMPGARTAICWRGGQMWRRPGSSWITDQEAELLPDRSSTAHRAAHILIIDKGVT